MSLYLLSIFRIVTEKVLSLASWSWLLPRTS